MRRLAFIVCLIALAAGSWVVTSASAGGSHTYKVELDNAFGLVSGSDVRVAGVNAGSIKSLDINAAKRAVVTIEVSGPFSDFRTDATCSSEPQSLIAEYFLDCQPGHAAQKSNGFIPVKNTTTTVANDLVFNTLRGSYAQRFQLILNEFGTALAGNPANLNAAIRRGAPALRSLRKALEIVGRENKAIGQLTSDSDVIIGKLTENRNNVIRFIHTANRAAEISASRRAELQRDFHLLPDFLAELGPTLANLDRVADEGTPLLKSLHASAGQLNRLSKILPPFADASKPALTTLGDASVVGKQALTNSIPTLRELTKASVKAPPTAKTVSDLLTALNNRQRSIEEDNRAVDDNCKQTPAGQLPAQVGDVAHPSAQTHAPSQTPPNCPASGTGFGYTALEGLLNYGYYQTTSTNQFDTLGHMIHISFYDLVSSPCSPVGAAVVGRFAGGPGVPNAAGNAATTDPNNTNRCVSWLGDDQPGITTPNLAGPYSGEACPQGSNDLSLCDPNVFHARSTRAKTSSRTVAKKPAQSGGKKNDGITGLLQLPSNALKGLGLEKSLKGQRQGNTQQNGESNGTAVDLLDFLFGT